MRKNKISLLCFSWDWSDKTRDLDDFTHTRTHERTHTHTACGPTRGTITTNIAPPQKLQLVILAEQRLGRCNFTQLMVIRAPLRWKSRTVGLLLN